MDSMAAWQESDSWVAVDRSKNYLVHELILLSEPQVSHENLDDSVMFPIDRFVFEEIR